MHKSRVHITLYGFDDTKVIGGGQIDSDICYVWVHILSFLYNNRTISRNPGRFLIMLFLHICLVIAMSLS